MGMGRRHRLAVSSDTSLNGSGDRLIRRAITLSSPSGMQSGASRSAVRGLEPLTHRFITVEDHRSSESHCALGFKIFSKSSLSAADAVTVTDASCLGQFSLRLCKCVSVREEIMQEHLSAFSQSLSAACGGVHRCHSSGGRNFRV